MFLNKISSLQKSNLSLEKELLGKVLGNQVILFQQLSPGKRKVEHVAYKHFKMESILDIFKIIKKDVWMASVELKMHFSQFL